MSRAIVGDCNLKDNGVADFRRAVAAGQCLHGHQIGSAVYSDGFFQIIANSTRVRLIASCRSRYVLNRVAAFANVNGSLQKNRGARAISERSNGPQSCRCVVDSLRNIAAGESDSCRKRIGKRNVGSLSRTVVGNFDFENNRVAFVRRAVAAGKRLDRDEIRVTVDRDRFFKIIANG